MGEGTRRFCAGLLTLTGLSTKTASEVTSFLISLATVVLCVLLLSC